MRAHDFPGPERGEAIPWGVCDLAADTVRVRVGAGHGTSARAVETLRRRWGQTGRRACPEAVRLQVACDGGGCNSSRGRLRKLELPGWAGELQLRVSASHFPAKTSKWNQIEHHMLCQILENRRGRLPVSREVAVDLIGAVTTKGGSTIQSALDGNSCETAREVTGEQMKSFSIERAEFHGEWNSTSAPRS